MYIYIYIYISEVKGELVRLVRPPVNREIDFDFVRSCVPCVRARRSCAGA